MVEKKELAILFVKKKISDKVTEFIPLKVIEGKYFKEDKCFSDENDKILYEHISYTKSTTIGFACRTTIEITKNILTEERLTQIKKEMFEYISQYKFIRDLNKNDLIIAINKSDGNSKVFKDFDVFIAEEEISNTLKNFNNNVKKSPKEIYEEVRKTIKGQDESIKTIATNVWATYNNSHISKKQMILIGPSGVGKTAIFEQLKNILGIPLTIFSVPGLSQAGYVGRSVDEILKQVYYENDENLDLAEQSIVFLDEIDKIAYHNHNSGDVSTLGVQNELLKLVEGCDRIVEIEQHSETFNINTSRMLFIASGAFQEIYESDKKNSIGFNNKLVNNEKIKKEITTQDLIDYGLKKELVGRFPIKVTLNSLTKEIFRDIILNSDKSELLLHVAFLKELGITITNLEDLIDIIIEDAMKKEIGARGLVETISNLFIEVIYQVANNPNKYETLTFGKNILIDKNDFTLNEKRTKVRGKYR